MKALKTVILPKLLSGARGGLPLEEIGAENALQALSLAGQALRFERPSPPILYEIEDWVADPRPIMPEPARKLLLRLTSGKSQPSAVVMTAIARMLETRNLRLHPFDLPKLEAFVRAHGEQLGAEALAFTQREMPVSGRQNYFAPDRLTDDNWMLATPAVKARFIAERRTANPAAARALVEAAWSGDNADNRLRILETFRQNLSADDAPFLDSLAKDRAPRVRDLAQGLLARLPGFAGDNPALRAVLERIKISKSGLVFKKTSLALELPATVQKLAGLVWVRENFSAIGLTELSRSLSLDPEELIVSAQKDSPMMFALFLVATGEKRFDLVAKIVTDHMKDAWDGVLAAGLDDLAGYLPEERVGWADIVVQPQIWPANTSLWSLVRLAQMMETPISARLFSAILKSLPWAELHKEPGKLTAEIADSMAALCPPEMRTRLRQEIAGFETAKAGNAMLFLELMDTLEATYA